MTPGDYFFNAIAAMKTARQGFVVDMLKDFKTGKAVWTGFVGV
jgi:hypothetical protein